MKRKSKVRRSRDLPPPGKSEAAAEAPSAPATPAIPAIPAAPATPERISIESVDEHKTGSIESVPQTAPEKDVAGFIEPGGWEAGSAR